MAAIVRNARSLFKSLMGLSISLWRVIKKKKKKKKRKASYLHVQLALASVRF